MMNLDMQEVVRRILRYLVEGLVVGLAASYLVKGTTLESAVMVGITASAVLALLDLGSSPIAGGARLGLGLQTGASVLGGF